LGLLFAQLFFFGVEGIVVGETDRCPITPAVAKASSGATEFIDMFQTVSLPQFLWESKENDWDVIGTVHAPSSMDCKDLTLTRNTILVLGNEATGLSSKVRHECSQLVAIKGHSPLYPIDSLNVGVANGIFLYQLLK